jgi:hypothetical protein
MDTFQALVARQDGDRITASIETPSEALVRKRNNRRAAVGCSPQLSGDPYIASPILSRSLLSRRRSG